MYSKWNEFVGKENVSVQRTKEFVTHDGYDVDGPESILYDMMVWYTKDGMHFVDEWHAEKWFSPSEQVVYERIVENYVDSDTYHSTLVADLHGAATNRLANGILRKTLLGPHKELDHLLRSCCAEVQTKKPPRVWSCM